MGIYGGPEAGNFYPPISTLTEVFNFGNVPVDSSKTAIIKIMNYRDTEITISDITLISDVFFTDNTGFTVAGSDTFDLEVTFIPNNNQIFQGNIELHSESHGDFIVKLSGNGVISDIGIPIVEINFSSIDLGNSDSSNVTITNSGYDTLRISQIYTTNTVFHLNKSWLNIAPRSFNNSLTVTFQPDSAKSYIDSLLLLSNDPDEGRMAIALKGSSHGPVINIDKDTLNFDQISLIPDTSLTLKITNLGDQSLSIHSFNIEQTDTVFTFVDESIPPDISPGNSYNLQIRYKANKTGRDNALVHVFSSDPVRDEKTVNLTGPGQIPQMYLSRRIISFGEIDISSFKTDTVYVHNTGDAPLVIDSLRIKGEQNYSFTFIDADTTALNIGVNDSLAVQIRFQPTLPEINIASLFVYGQDQNNSVDSVLLSGFGIAPKIELSTTTLEFGEIMVDTSKTDIFLIYNKGKGNLLIDSMIISGTEKTSFSFIQTDTNNITIKPDSSLKVTLRFSPSRKDTNEARLFIYSNAYNSIKDSVTLSGIAMTAKVEFSLDTLQFSAVALDSSTDANILIYNKGEATLHIDSLNIRGLHKSSFGFINIDTTDITVAPEAFYETSIRFSPSFKDTNKAILCVYSSDHLGITKDSIDIIGMGLAPEIELARTILTYDTIAIDFVDMDPVTETIYIKNTGTSDLRLYPDRFSFEGDTNSFITNLSDMDTLIHPGDSTKIHFSFQTVDVGKSEAQLTIVSNDPFSEITIIYLKAFAIDKPASIAYDSTSSTKEFLNNKPATLSFNISTYSTINNALLHYRMGGENNWHEDSITKQGESTIWSITLDSKWLTPRGLEYYISTEHGYTSTIWPENNPCTIQITVTGLNAFHKTRKNFYQEISVPLQTNGLTLSKLVEEKLGSYNINEYRIYDCLDGINNVEMKNSDDILTPGKAYWLITKESVTLDINDTTYSVPSDVPFNINLHRGWNLIASPFSFPVSWADIDTHHALRFFSENGDWTFDSVLRPYLGYSVYTEKDTILSIQPIETSIKKNLPKTEKLKNTSEWDFQIIATAGKLRDSYNYAGVKMNSSAEIDRYDYPEPLAIGNFISLYLLPENRTSHYSTDYRSPDEEGYIYNFELSGNIDGEKTIRIVPNNIPDYYNWIIVSPDTKVIYSNDVIKTRNKNIQYKLIIGTDSYIDEVSSEYTIAPTTFQLAQNFPNPFNPETKVKYQLPQNSIVTIDIYSVLGQRVTTLLDNEPQEAGYYQMIWDGTNSKGNNVSTGLYFLFLRTEHFSHGIKMILQR